MSSLIIGLSHTINSTGGREFSPDMGDLIGREGAPYIHEEEIIPASVRAGGSIGVSVRIRIGAVHLCERHV